MDSLATDHPRPMGVCTRFVTRCDCGSEFKEQLIAWHYYKQAKVISSGICPKCQPEFQENVEALCESLDEEVV